MTKNDFMAVADRIGIISILLSVFIIFTACHEKGQGTEKVGYSGNVIEISCYNSGITYNCWTVSRVSENGEPCYYYEYNNSSKNDGKVRISTEKGDEIFSCFDEMKKDCTAAEGCGDSSISGVNYLCEGNSSNQKAELSVEDFSKIFDMITGLEKATSDK